MLLIREKSGSLACFSARLGLLPLFTRWTRLGLWRRLLNRLVLAWRQACDWRLRTASYPTVQISRASSIAAYWTLARF